MPTVNPIYTAVLDNQRVDKNPFRQAWSNFAYSLTDVAALRDHDGRGQKLIFVGQNLFKYDAADTTTADDGVNCIHDSTGKRYKWLQFVGGGGLDEAGVRATALTGISFASAAAVVAGDSVLVAMGKLQAQTTEALSKTYSRTFRTRADFAAATLTAAPDDVTINYYDTSLVPIDTLFKNQGTVNPSVPNQIVKTVGPSTFYYTPQSAYERPENHGAKGDNVAIDGPALLAAINASMANGKECALGGRNKTYLLNAQTLIAPSAGQNLRIVGDGATIKMASSSTDVFRMLYIAYNAVAVGDFKLKIEGINIDGNAKTAHPLLFANSVATGWFGEIILDDINMIGGLGPATGWNCSQLTVRGRVQNVSINRVKCGKFTKSAGNDALDYTNLTITNDGSENYANHVDINNAVLGGVFCNTATNYIDSDSLKIFGQAPVAGTLTADENYCVRNSLIEIGAYRGIKVQVAAADIYNIHFTTKTGNYSGASALSTKVGNRQMGIDFQYGTGKARDLHFDFEDGTGVDFPVQASQRTYGIKRSLVVDGVYINKRGASDNPVLRGLYRSSGVSGAPAPINVNNFVSNHTVTSIAGIQSQLDGALAANRAETIFVSNSHVATATEAAVTFFRTAPATANVITSNCSQEGTAVPVVVQNGGGANFTSSVLAANRGFT